ncbi:V-type ATP synthase subunit I [Haloparvum sp. PAK95]|uniref:V-type ATP synthase subunit I n=1 Tax=Haloparvum sp. PAK95 TaxID=3418962 RepID=UPI003D2EE29B
MLRPEQMSRVSVTGSKRVIDDVIDAAYDHNSLHVSDYGNEYEGFTPGSSLEGAEEVNEKLVTVRSLESILDVEDADAGPRGVLEDEELEAELEDVRTRVNELDDRRNEIDDEIRELDEEIDRLSPFADLGIDLDLLRDYDTLEVVVGQADPDAVEAQLADAGGIDAFDVFAGDDAVAAFAKPADVADPGVLQDALVGVDITFLSVPEGEGSPESYLAELETEKAKLEEELEAVDQELEAAKTEAAGFLLRAEEQLTIEAQKKEAPLSFATTENAFVAEGWIPTDSYDGFAATVKEAVGDHAEIEEIERAEFTPDGDHHSESVGEAATDGGHEQPTEEPPVVQDNPKIATPFETLVQAVSRPKYTEFDPTLLVFLTFPAMFGFMIGDIGYGVGYLAIGYYFYSKFDTPGLKNVGAIGMWAGAFTVLFGIMFGFDVFGYHSYSLLGFEHWDASKGVSPAETSWAQAWLVITVLFGVLHLNVGYVLSFISNLKHHSFLETMYESGSWLLLINGLWAWVFSAHLYEAKPDLLFEAFNTALGISFTGLPETVGFLGLAAVVAGIVLLAIGEPAELPEVLSPLVNTISYTRITAVLLAKAGMAIAVNLLAFGAYMDHGHFKFIFTAENLAHAQEAGYEVVFAGMTTQGPVGIAAGLVVALIGHIVVLALGITAAGIQGVRLEYVEFFNKFYEGGGRRYVPFGYDRQYTAEE